MERARTDAMVGQQLDGMPVTRLHCLAVALCATGFAVDAFEITMGNMLSAVFASPPYSTPPGGLSLLLAAVFVGAAIGAPLSGWLADRHGRRKMLIALMLYLALTSVGAAASRDVGDLTAWRALSGVALGAYPPLMVAYLTDLLPAAHRGRMLFVTVAISSLGPLLGTFMVRALVPLQPLSIEAWRWGFIVGAVASAAVGALFLRLPESPRWLAVRGRAAEAWEQCERLAAAAPVIAAAPQRQPEAPAANAAAPAGWRRWPLVAVLFFLSPWSAIAFPLLTGTILAQRGFALADTLFYVGLSTMGALVGNLLGSFVIDRTGRRTALAVCGIATGGLGYLFIATGSPVLLAASSFGFLMCSMISVSVLTLYASELFPTEIRASAISSAWACNRVGAACAPMLLLPLLASGGAHAMYGVIAVSIAASLVLLCLAPLGRPGCALR
ncbi:MFS transporter [Massilia sp. IC2-477]|uniref:MFS transporter n=1 Tax=Massilia sp. IC2-477 TaxID=2887198 RepID=UPI001D11929F|nr:MFS transporter [Massilia sp. IC2-477]MCC2957555.1 MFS transporter [Massilia sp. IC2-477]